MPEKDGFPLCVVFIIVLCRYDDSERRQVMDQIKTGSFLKELRKEKKLTQEKLAETLGVSNRTVSRWETGTNMPDIGMLAELAEFYGVSISEIIDGERTAEQMNTQNTVMKMAEYGQNEVKNGKQRTAGYLLSGFGIFIIVSAFAVFPVESSWGSIYAVLGSTVFCAGCWCMIPAAVKKAPRILAVLSVMMILTGLFSAFDYISVTQFHQVPRFSLEKSWSSEYPEEVVHKTLFFTAVQKNPGTEKETVELIKQCNR